MAYFSNLQSLETSDEFTRWLSEAGVIDAVPIPEDGYTINLPTASGEEDFGHDIDHANLNGVLDHHVAVMVDLYANDWVTFFNLPQSTPSAQSSVYSDDTTATTPASPFSIASDHTAVDLSFAVSPKLAFLDDVNDVQQYILQPPAESCGYRFGAFEQGSPSVMCNIHPGSPGPFAFSFHRDMGTDTYGQLQQQYLSGAAASFAEHGMSMPADDSVAPLTSQLFTGPSEARCEAVPENSASTATSASKKRSSSVDGEKPSKTRKRQSTEKTLECPECGSMWARRNNLDTHIKSVHGEERAFACSALECARTFSRKHDLRRHFQSRHTDKGSPRRKAPKA